jgi:hypothetical protein
MNTSANHGVKTKVIASLAAGIVSGMGGLASAQSTATDVFANANVVHYGSNPTQCVAPFTPNDQFLSGLVNVHTDLVLGKTVVTVSASHLLRFPPTTYTVDVRCVGSIGTISPSDISREGTANKTFIIPAQTSAFYIDFYRVEPSGVLETFIAGPFNP